MTRITLSSNHRIEGRLSVEEAICKRRSVRDFSGKTLSISLLSDLLYYADGITEERDRLRAAPSAGATYPIELYLLANKVNDLPVGVYHYLALSHEIETVNYGDFRHDISQAAVHEKMILSANCVFILSAVIQRTQRVYGDRADRYIYFEAGHIAQNIYLAATSIGLGACAIGAFYDNQINSILGLDGKRESAIYILALGTIQ